MEHHSQDSKSSRTPVACASCHKRKLRCDDSTPCRSCTRNLIECIRVGLDGDSGMNMRLDVDNDEDENGSGNDDHLLTNAISEVSTMSTAAVLPSTHVVDDQHQQSWFPPVQDAWSLPLPFPPHVLNASSPSDLNDGGLVQWAVDHAGGERGRDEGAFAAAVPDGTPYLLPATNGPPVERLASTPWHDVDQEDRTAASVASQSSASPRSPPKDYVTDLHSCINKDSLATKRLVQVYFAEIHPYWPILHAPTFETANASHVLLGSMILLAGRLKGELNHMKLAPLVFDAVTATLQV